MRNMPGRLTILIWIATCWIAAACGEVAEVERAERSVEEITHEHVRQYLVEHPELVLEDPTAGIDIPAGEQVILEIEVVLEDTPTNVTGLAFSNTATYLYNYVDGNLYSQRVGAAGTSVDMTIVGPETMVVEKTGPASMTLGAAATFTLNMQNTGSGDAWNSTLVDQLPNGPNAGVCDKAPNGFTAQVFEANGTTAVSAPLVEDTDFNVTFRGQPNCDFTLDFLTAATTVGPTERLIVAYQSVLDDDGENGENGGGRASGGIFAPAQG